VFPSSLGLGLDPPPPLFSFHPIVNIPFGVAAHEKEGCWGRHFPKWEPVEQALVVVVV